jgi:hypothetical protein
MQLSVLVGESAVASNFKLLPSVYLDLYSCYFFNGTLTYCCL